MILALLLAGTVMPEALQGQDEAYKRTATERAEKIVRNLELRDADKAAQVTVLIAAQYVALNQIHGLRDKQLAERPEDSDAIQAEAEKRAGELHQEYVGKLAGVLTPEQVDKVKDGMTYDVVPKTYLNYQLMLPYLSDAQLSRIYGWLVEAREQAMDGGSSEEKHAWFNKYKGKITNFLAQEGFNLKQESEDWAKRRNVKDSTLMIVAAARIADKLVPNGGVLHEQVRNLTAFQYQQLERIAQWKDARLRDAGAQDTPTTTKQRDEAVTMVWTAAKARQDEQRNKFFDKLGEWLPPDQLDLIKDEMTGYRLLKEYDRFQKLLPDMTEEDKRQVYQLLIEARENAVNVLSEREQNQWFAKYCGRANNYLSKKGYDLRAATNRLEESKR